MEKRIVVKCGTQLLTTPSGLDEVYIEQIAAQIAALMQDEVEVVLVTSGAVAAGRATLHLPGNQLITRQVLAAVGQAPLIGRYATAFAEHGTHRGPGAAVPRRPDHARRLPKRPQRF